MPSKQWQRKNEKKSKYQQQKSAVTTELQSPNESHAHQDTPRKRGRPPKNKKATARLPRTSDLSLSKATEKHLPNLSILTISPTPSEKSHSTDSSIPVRKKSKAFESDQPQLIDFSQLQLLDFAQVKNPEATIWKKAGLRLYDVDAYAEVPNSGPRLIETLWNNLGNWLNEQFTFAFLCILAKKASRPTVVVDSLLTDPIRTPANRTSRTISRGCYNPLPGVSPEIIFMPMFFSNHWALVICDVAYGNFFVDSLAQNPPRLSHSRDLERNRLIRDIFIELVPHADLEHMEIEPLGHELVSQQPDGNSCGYFICLFGEAWIFNNRQLTLEPLCLNTEKRRILWHINQLYSTDNIEYQSRYKFSNSIPPEDMEVDDNSVFSESTQDFMDLSLSSLDSASDTPQFSRQRTQKANRISSETDLTQTSADFALPPTPNTSRRGRPKKLWKAGPGRGNSSSLSISTPLYCSTPLPKTPTQELNDSSTQQNEEFMNVLTSPALELPYGPPPRLADMVAVSELVANRDYLRQLWKEPNTWLQEDMIYSYQRYIAFIVSDKKVAVLSPQYFRMDIHFGPEAFHMSAIENCYNYSAEYDILFATVYFEGGHYALLIFDRTLRDHPKCYFVDPMPTCDRLYDPDYPNFDFRRVELIGNTLNQLTPGLSDTNFDFLVRHLTPSGQSLETHGPQSALEYTAQNDDINCGFFILLYTEAYLLNKGTLILPNLDINLERRRILWHLAQLTITDHVEYHGRMGQPKKQVRAATPAKSSHPKIPKRSSQRTVSASSDNSEASIVLRRSPRIASISNSRASSVENIPKDSPMNPLTQRCHIKHSGFYCADFRAQHTVGYYDSGNLGDKVCDFCSGEHFKSEAKTIAGKTSASCCQFGKVRLAALSDPPDYLKKLLTLDTPEAKEFRAHMNLYNSLMSFASVTMGYQENSMMGGVCFLMNGEFKRCISSIVSGKHVPSHSQLFICNPDEALELRKNNQYAGDRVKEETLRKLDTMIRESHPLAKKLENFHELYKKALAIGGPDAVANFRLTLLDERQAPASIRDPSLHQRQVNLPTEGTLFAVHADADYPPPLKGIWISTDDGVLKEFPPYHPMTDSLCYPLLFPCGDDGYHKNIPTYPPAKSKRKSKPDENLLNESCEEDELESISENCSMIEDEEDDEESDDGIPMAEEKVSKPLSLRDYVRYRMAFRKKGVDTDYHSIWSASAGLGQKLILDYSARIDADIANYLRHPEMSLRSSLPENLLRWFAKNAKLTSTDELGSIVMFRKTNPGTRPYFQERYYDATTIMARVKKPACACFFLTFTSNPRWPEISRNFLRKDQKIVDCFNIVCRVFEDKLKELHRLLDKKNILGKILGYAESREFQKRIGGPHIHRVYQSDIIAIPENIDNLIWAHIPPKPDDQDQSGMANFIRTVRQLVAQFQLHDCAEYCLNKRGKCRYGFPKPYSSKTVLFDDKPPLYFRPSPDFHGETLTAKRHKVQVTYDNSRVVAYNPFLLVYFGTHHNLEFAYGKNTDLRYLNAYPFKGPSFSYMKTSQDGLTNVDEPAFYQKMLYRSPSEAFSRIMSYRYSVLSHTVIPLTIHLPGKQKVYIQPGKAAEVAEKIKEGLLPETPLTAYWKQWRIDFENNGEMVNVLFEQVPEKFTFDRVNKVWKRLKRVAHQRPRVGRIYPISPGQSEKFALYILMKHIPGDEEQLKTFNGHKCETFLEAARLRGLIDDSDVWIRTLKEASASLMPNQMRQLFAGILIFGSTEKCVVDAKMLWERFQQNFYDIRCTDAERPGRIDRALALIERLLVAQGKSCQDFGLPNPTASILNDPRQAVDDFFFPTYANEVETDETVDLGFYEKSKLNSNQQEFFDLIIKCLKETPNRNGSNRLFYLSGDGGTGKTFLMNYILYMLRRNGIKALPTASTGMAATRYYSGGTTLHSAFRLGIDLDHLPLIAADSYFGRKIIEAQVIMVDEVTMLNKRAFEIVEEVCRIMPLKPEYKNFYFGGRLVLITGDWQQSAPPVEDDYTMAASVEACIQSSHLYERFQKYRLHENMRVNPGQVEFLEWLRKIGRGETGDKIAIPKRMIVHRREKLVETGFPDGFEAPAYQLLKGLMLATTNRIVDLNNDAVLSTFSTEYVEYLSADTPMSSSPFAVNAADFDISQLNELQPSGMPPHRLKLKVGSIVVLLLNLNTSKALCNGTRLIIRALTPNLIKAVAITGGASSGGIEIGISRARFTFKSKRQNKVSFERFQFPVRPAFTMTIQKAQGQSVDRLGIDFTEESFAHGQTYTAFSRATNWDNIKVYAPNKPTDEDGNVLVANIVSKDIKLD